MQSLILSLAPVLGCWLMRLLCRLVHATPTTHFRHHPVGQHTYRCTRGTEYWWLEQNLGDTTFACTDGRGHRIKFRPTARPRYTTPLVPRSGGTPPLRKKCILLELPQIPALAGTSSYVS